jgi:hypothetical protein
MKTRGSFSQDSWSRRRDVNTKPHEYEVEVLITEPQLSSRCRQVQPPSISEVKNDQTVPPLPLTSSWHSAQGLVCLVKLSP